MASPTRWTFVWVNSWSWWWTGRPPVLWFMGSQRIGQDWATELNWTESTYLFFITTKFYFIFLTYFNWRNIALQFCIGFSPTTCKSAIIIHMYNPISKKAMAPHSSPLAWKIPWMEGPGSLQSMGLLGVGHDWATSLSLLIFMHWRRKWQPTPVFLPGEYEGWGSLMGCRLWGSHRFGHDWRDLAVA